MPEHRIDRLSAADALRALYIDFEGNKDRPPVLLGVHRVGRGEHPHVQQDVTDPLFDGLVPRYLPLPDAVRNVVVRAERKGRMIVAWTQHELDVVRRDCAEDADLVRRFEARYVNAYAVAKRWRNRLHSGDKPDEGTLYAWLELIWLARAGRGRSRPRWQNAHVAAHHARGRTATLREPAGRVGAVGGAQPPGLRRDAAPVPRGVSGAWGPLSRTIAGAP